MKKVAIGVGVGTGVLAAACIAGYFIYTKIINPYHKMGLMKGSEVGAPTRDGYLKYLRDYALLHATKYGNLEKVRFSHLSQKQRDLAGQCFGNARQAFTSINNSWGGDRGTLSPALVDGAIGCNPTGVIWPDTYEEGTASHLPPSSPGDYSCLLKAYNKAKNDRDRMVNSCEACKQFARSVGIPSSPAKISKAQSMGYPGNPVDFIGRPSIPACRTVECARSDPLR